VLKHHTLLAAILVLFGGYILYIHQMPSRGLVGPDEPRYASIAREMAQSGDWVTPRLNGEPWFEKPALLYWLGAAATNFGIEDDRATRLPVALLSIAFLCFFYWQLRREFGPPAAAYATLILATSAGWVAYSQVGVFDIPLAVFVSSALLILLPWIANPSAANRWRIAAFGALLGAAFLAKGLVGPAIAFLALLSVCRDRKPLQVARDLFHPRVLVSFAVLALPWYVLCYLQNGPAFLNEFFWRHHVDRVCRGFEDRSNLILQKINQAGELHDENDHRDTDKEGFKRHHNDKYIPDASHLVGRGFRAQQEVERGDQTCNEEGNENRSPNDDRSLLAVCFFLSGEISHSGRTCFIC
jgi:4-amino-4-deoxy-L-arabinose transferase-like glycosyltransferase